jgi:hypothetical protein
LNTHWVKRSKRTYEQVIDYKEVTETIVRSLY